MEAELNRTLKRLNLLMIVLAVELLPLTLLAVYFLLMMLSQNFVAAPDWTVTIWQFGARDESNMS
jgi:hypothetical protein